MLVPVIMAGGSGTRLWPLSRQHFPKQFLPLVNESTMLQTTLSRLEGLPIERSITICNEQHRFIVAEQLRRTGELGTIILEPAAKNTAPALALAALSAQSSGEDPVLLVLAADHVIEDEAAFQNAVSRALVFAQQDKLVTFGIVPVEAHTGYGYIKQGSSLDNGAYQVDSFIEKPDAQTAQQYLESGQYLWNSGMFLFKASRYLEALGRFRPDILSACQQSIATLEPDLDFVRVDPIAFAKCPAESIDYAVMEPLASLGDDVVVMPLDAGWNDVGSWSSLWKLAEKDSAGNHLHGDVIAHDTNNSYVRAQNRLVATIGIDNLVVVDTPDALLVASLDRVQDVKIIVEQLKQQRRTEATTHREVYRPWGKYDSIDSGERHQVKHITVKPGGKLSVQMHHHRAEHWIIVSGTALVTNGDNEILLTENQSTYIPIGVKHALENPGKIALELIEVQSGAYLGEDDIVRFEDIYGRVNKKNL
ncbi:MAG: mannose-1-phosphate guanylyltransferase/mannose-6-phosphate isomerase [Gammaproteobacteria bacterium]|nr:mannose-1-phosphate guanylyltransferase/mannose-6-phosphate isomerase [Gammaproteobacteria bacterium]